MVAEEPKVHVETDEQYLRCDLTPEEFSAKADELTRAIDAHVQAEEEKKAAQADLKSRIEKAAAEVCRLNNIVRNRYEMRQVEVNTEYDFDAQQVRVIRTDTGDILEEREMRMGERDRQASLFPEKNQGEAEEAA
jgi:hypothetical protein